jgi:chromosomal replication initiation ATPase DnaA
MASQDQLPLNLGHNTSYSRDDYVSAPANELPLNWIERWPDWPAGGLVLTGPGASGKSHLAAIWAVRSKAKTIFPFASSNLDDARSVCPPHGRVLIEDCDSALEDGKLGAEFLFHLFNLIQERSGALLLTARTAPAVWPGLFADIASRLATLPVIEIVQPDDDLLRALLLKQFSDRQRTLAASVIDYILARIERSYGAVSEIVARLDATAEEGRRAVTIPLVRSVLEP